MTDRGNLSRYHEPRDNKWLKAQGDGLNVQRKDEASIREGSARLLRRQLETGQYDKDELDSPALVKLRLEGARHECHP